VLNRTAGVLDDWWTAAAPASRLATLRMLCGGFALGYVVVRLHYLADYSRFAASHFHPVGVVSILGEPLPAAGTWALAVMTIAAGLAFVSGWRFRWTGPLFAGLFLWVTSYRNSWGMIFHTENLLVLHVIALGLSPAADALALDSRRAGGAELGLSGRNYGWPIKLMSTLTVLTYVLAGIAKIRYVGMAWVNTEFLQHYLAYDAIRKIELGSTSSLLGAGLLNTGWSFRPFAVFSLAIELGAPLALMNRRFAAVWALSVVAFHLGVLGVMAILFPYPLFGVGLASFFRVEQLTDRVREKLNRR
jgi:hypothetical protein